LILFSQGKGVGVESQGGPNLCHLEAVKQMIEEPEGIMRRKGIEVKRSAPGHGGPGDFRYG